MTAHLVACIASDSYGNGSDRKGARWMSRVGVQVRKAEPIEKALRRFKRKLEKEGVMKDIKKNSSFTKPSQRRRMKHGAAIRRVRKQALEGT